MDLYVDTVLTIFSIIYIISIIIIHYILYNSILCFRWCIGSLCPAASGTGGPLERPFQSGQGGSEVWPWCVRAMGAGL